MDREQSIPYIASEILKINNLIQHFNSNSKLTQKLVAKGDHGMILKPL